MYNPLGVVPGALVRADNAVLSRENTLENRRGYKNYSDLAGEPSQLFTYSGRALVQYGTSVAYDDGSGTFTAYSGSYSPPSGVKMRAEKAKSNLYVTTSTGVKVFSDVAGTAARLAGAPRSLDPSYTLTGASGFLANNFQCAYRVTIQRTDANSNVITGYPSQRLWVVNSAGGSRNVILRLYFPSDIISGDVVQFFRTDQQSGTSSDTSGNEMKLAYQATVTSADIVTGYIDFTDSIVDTLLGASLYTSPSQEGIAQANERPPLCKDLALYKSQFMFYANTSTKQRLYFTLVGTSGLTGNTITLAGVTYNFGAAENTATGTAKVFATGVAAVDIDDTARSLVKVINRYASNTSVYAYYLSGPEDLPGQIIIEERGVGASAFTIQGSNSTIGGMFFPPPPTSPATNTKSTSSNEVATNRLYFSKADQPEHVPLLNYVNVGPANSAILRIVALRDSLICITDSGVYRLTGEDSNSFSVVPLDLTVICKSADSVATLANTVFMVSNQGIVSISDSGVQVVSREIEDQLRPLVSYSNFDDYTCGVSYESERLYLLSTVDSSDATSPTQIFVYNVFTRGWTKWTFGFTSAVVESVNDKLYFSKSGDSVVYQERKSFSDSDFSDPESDVTITAISGDTVTFTSLTATPEEGWVLMQGTTGIVIDELSSVGTTHTATLLYSAPSSWTTGAATLFPDVGFRVEWNAWTGGQPGLLKHVRQYEILTDQLTGQNNTTSLTATFKTDLDGNTDEVPIESASYKWGSSPWGEFEWGGRDDTYAYPTWPPANKHYCRLMSVGVLLRNANEKVAISGYSLTYELISERISK
jgi:hypothetical protein